MGVEPPVFLGKPHGIMEEVCVALEFAKPGSVQFLALLSLLIDLEHVI